LIDRLRSEEGGYVYGAAFSPDGKLLVAGGRDSSRRFGMWRRAANWLTSRLHSGS
jgi:hypothetical protein